METRTRAENRCKSAGIHREMSIHRQESGDVDENPPELRQQLNDAYSKQKRYGAETIKVSFMKREQNLYSQERQS